MALYQYLTENDIREAKNEIVSLGQKAIKYIELGGADSIVVELMQKQKDLKDLVQRWEEWQRIKDLSFSDLI